MQITRFLAFGRSGFFCAEPSDTEEPWWVHDRTEQLMERSLCKGADPGLGLRVPSFDLDGDTKPKIDLSFIRDRWPRFIWKTNAFTVLVHYFVQDGIVIQNYILERNLLNRPQESKSQRNDVEDVEGAEDERVPSKRRETATQETDHSANDTGDKDTMDNSTHDRQVQGWPDLEIPTDLLIRDLEWQDSAYGFNEEYNEPPDYSTYLSSQEHSLVIIHKDPRAPHDGRTFDSPPGGVGLVISPFVNSRAATLRKITDRLYAIQHNSLETAKSLNVTVAYRLQLLKRKNCWQSSLVRTSDITMSDALSTPFFKQPFFPSSSAYFDFVMRRNLKHILSVCSIPVSNELVWDFDECGERLSCTHASENRTAIALTCGDISGHSVVISASL